jgi:hypothetical protein
VCNQEPRIWRRWWFAHESAISGLISCASLVHFRRQALALKTQVGHSSFPIPKHGKWFSEYSSPKHPKPRILICSSHAFWIFPRISLDPVNHSLSYSWEAWSLETFGKSSFLRLDAQGKPCFSFTSQIVAKPHGWSDMIREAIIFFPNDPYPRMKPSPRPVAVVLLHSPRGGEASLHTTLASALPHCDTRVTIPRILRVDRSWRSIFLSLDTEISFKQWQVSGRFRSFEPTWWYSLGEFTMKLMAKSNWGFSAGRMWHHKTFDIG